MNEICIAYCDTNLGHWARPRHLNKLMTERNLHIFFKSAICTSQEIKKITTLIDKTMIDKNKYNRLSLAAILINDDFSVDIRTAYG